MSRENLIPCSSKAGLKHICSIGCNLSRIFTAELVCAEAISEDYVDELADTARSQRELQ